MTNRFEKIYCLDTNIILDDAKNIITLSDKGKNLIILPETVLDEIDSKKSGWDEINFQAREFGRMLFDAEIKDKKKVSISTDGKNHDVTIIETSVECTTIFIISKVRYDADKETTSANIRNDRKILEITKEIMSIENYSHLKFISLDVMARTRAISLGIETEALNLGSKEINLEFIKEINITDTGLIVTNGEPIEQYDPDYKPNNYAYIFENDGKKILACIQNRKLVLFDEGYLRKQTVNPMNKEQLFFSYALLDDFYNIVITEAKAGCSLPGSNIEVQLNEDWIYKEELSKYIDVSELTYIRQHNYINFKKETNKKFLYDKNSIKYNLIKMLNSNDRSRDMKTLNNDKNYTSKYCKLSYWLGFTDFEFAIKKVRSIRKYSKFFESPELNNFTNFNPNNFNKIIADIQSQFIQIDKNIILLTDLYNYSNSMLDLNYWFFRGWSEEDARYRISDIQHSNGLKYGLKRKNTPEKYNDIQQNQPLYWVKQGYSDVEAKLLVKERQTTFSMDICVLKYGVEEGTRIFNDRQHKWQKTLKNKSAEEITNINASKMVGLTKASKASLEVFTKVIELLNLTDYYLGIEGSKEYFIAEKNNKICFYDFTLLKEKKIIEFNGHSWHPTENQTDWVSVYGDISYDEALFNDQLKIERAKNHGFEVLVIWDSNSVEHNINECINFIRGSN